ncbi:MAG: phage holin [Acutalibacteraceae bacterium]
MKINLKARLQNKTFVITTATLLVTFIYQIFALAEIVPKVSEDFVIELLSLVVNMLAVLGVLVDPTTEGISDSARAMTYCTDCDVREKEKKVESND